MSTNCQKSRISVAVSNSSQRFVTSMTDQTGQLASRHVAVIGAGASGLAAARELLREGHSVVVFERAEEIGGTWLYTPRIESDPIGLDPNRSIVHSSMYESLRTNLPRELMGFRDYPFLAREDDEVRDSRRFPGHREVLMYLRDFSREFGLDKFVRFETEVLSVSPVTSSEPRTPWRVVSKKKRKKGESVELGADDEIFDAVVICSGHNSKPRVAQIPGIDAWPGKQIHSHNYRTPNSFRDQVVLLIGTGPSAIDISRDISPVVKEAHIASTSNLNPQVTKLPRSDNIYIHPKIKSVHGDGSVVFEDNSVIIAHTILHCTGYEYEYPFLKTDGIVSVDDNRVGPLYKHVFPPEFAPWISFVGIPFKTIPFALYELQSKWISGVLSNRIRLPSEQKMTEDISVFYSKLKLENVPKRHTHVLFKRAFEYEDWLVSQCDCPSYEQWRKDMSFELFARYEVQSATYRDDEDLILIEKRDFQKHFSKRGSRLRGSRL